MLVTGDRSTLTGRLASTVSEKFCLRLSDRADYALIGLSPRQLPTNPPVGSGVRVRDLAFVQSGVLSLWEIVPQVAVRVVRFGTGVEGRIEAGPAFDLWEFDNEQRNRVGARGAVALQWPLARSLTGSLRVGGVWSESVADPGDVPAGVERVTTRRFDVAIGLRYTL